MNKGKIARLVGFAGALGLSAVLVATAVSGTGAYFTDSQNATLTGQAGTITLTTSSPTDLSFTKLIPGTYQTKSITYSVGGDAAQDVWLVFTDSYAYCKFTGATGDALCGDGGGGMGRYGHFAVSNTAGTTLFSSYNLQVAPASSTDTCITNATNGWGLGAKPNSASDKPAYCGVPLAIKLESNLASGTNNRSVNITFGVTGFQTQQSQAAPPAELPFQIVGTQVGHLPLAPNF